MPGDNPLRGLVFPKVSNVRTISEVAVKKILQCNELLEALDNIHKDVYSRRDKALEAAIQRHNEQTGVRSINFSIGDFVLVAKSNATDGHKLQVKWCGPQRIIGANSDSIFECQDLINSKVHLVHANRIKFYADSQLNVTKELLESVKHNEPHYEIVTKIHDLQYNRSSREWELLCSWKGFDSQEWEPLRILSEDIPEMVNNFLATFPDQGKAERAKKSISS